MGRKTNYQGKSKVPSFVMLTHYMMDSPAWKSLPPISQALWLHIRRRYNGNNNGDIPLGCRDAARFLNISKNTAADAFKDLLDRGFIKVGQDSDFRLKSKTTRRWVMTDESYGGHGPTNEWRQWGKEVSKVEENRKPVS